MKLKTEGIVCSGCAEDMEKVLRDTDGIIDVSVSYKDEIVSIKYDPDVIDRKKVYFAARKLSSVSKILSET